MYAIFLSKSQPFKLNPLSRKRIIFNRSNNKYYSQAEFSCYNTSESSVPFSICIMSFVT